MSERRHVVVLMGGDSAEREVSLDSGRAVAAAIDPQRFQVTAMAWNGALPSQRDREEHWGAIRVLHVGSSELLDTLTRLEPDVTFIALHGGSGENGNLQAMLEKVGLRYTGSGPVASALGMDKVASKQLFERWGLTTPRYLSLPKHDLEALGPDRVRDAVVAELGLPVVVKPVAAGSTLGVTVVKAESELPAAIAHALTLDTRVLIEQYIAGVELTAGLLGTGEEVLALPLIEIVPNVASGFFDYQAKYTSGGATHLIPPRLEESIQQRVRDMAVDAYRALGCRGVARADFMVEAAGLPYLLEVNTVPGMTATSLVPDAARAAGLDFPALVQRLLEQALSD